MKRNTVLSLGLLGFISKSHAQLPYNPTHIISTRNGSVAYIFDARESSQFSLTLLNTSAHVASDASRTILSQDLPFLSNTVKKSFTPIGGEQGLDVLAGNCQDSTQELELWRFTPNEDYGSGEWESIQLTPNDASPSANFLAAGTSFSASTSSDDPSIYVFGGMCPDGEEITAENWVSQATYSNTMLTLSPESANDDTPYHLSMTGSRAPPIAEAGLTMTPLTPSFTDSTSGSVSQQQNFVLLGGHTENAFINMSQVAIFSLPQESWTFVGVDQPFQGSDTELMARDVVTVEPRSGHTAVLSQDGSRIIVLGGWVGDIYTPAMPQLVVLEVGEGYGGVSNWRWTVPDQSAMPYGVGVGVYGHGATLMPGGIVVVTGGQLTTRPGTRVKRDSTNRLLFLNMTSMEWMDDYINPTSPSSPAYDANASASAQGLSKTERTGLGAGLGLGFAAVIGLVIVWFLYRRRLNERRSVREKELRELALGAERCVNSSADGDPDQRYPERRSASWHSMQERQMESHGPHSQQVSRQNEPPLRMDPGNSLREAERTGALMEVPSPTRGLRRSLHSRGAIGMFQPMPGGAPGSVFRIDEEDENSQPGSLKRAKTPKTGDRSSVHSDPFKDPPQTADSEAAEQRKKEVQGWVEDWQSAAESMHLSRNPSQATHGRTYSNLSQAANSHSSSSDPSGRGSPDKSDRTGSNLSEKSAYSQASLQRSMTGTVSRNLSQRSASAGYALIAGAAAAVGRVTGQRSEQADYGTNSNLSRFPSNRSVSLNAASFDRAPSRRERAETFSSAKTSFGPGRPGEDQGLLNKWARDPADDYWTPPESPVKEKDAKHSRTGSLTRTGVKAMGLLGSVRRVFSGTGGVSVQDRVATLESKSESPSPTKSQPEMSERSLNDNEAFWRGKRGARDWEHKDGGEPSSGPTKSHTVKRKPLPGQVEKEGEHDEDWDIETAVQKRVVQVMFTVPKEKLRVVNADALSLLSSNRSDVDRDEEQEREREVKRMSSVREGDEDMKDDNDTSKGKGKEVLRD